MNQKILDVIDRHEKFMFEKWGDDLLLSYGPGHIVYGDYNVEHPCVLFCIKRALTSPLTEYTMFDHHAFTEAEKQEIINDTIKLLEEFLEIPEEECYVWEEEDN